jgi:hypothetical protein
MSSLSTGPQRPPWFATACLGGGLVLLALHFWRARDYYAAPLKVQALDPRHAALRSSGSIGLALGVAAAALMVANLAYLLRRRAIGASWSGSLQAWMNLHVVSGLLAAGCVLLHSAFGVRSASGGVASAALVIVVLTGAIGRYVHSRVPRTREGRELSLDEARRRFEELRRELAGLGLPPLSGGPIEATRGRSIARSLARALFGDRSARAEHRRYKALLRERTPERRVRRKLEPLLDRILTEAQALTRLAELSALMSSWRFLHRWLALVMVGTAACHVAIALRYGALPWQELVP